MAGVLEVVILFVILYCVFNSRGFEMAEVIDLLEQMNLDVMKSASAMVDVLSARMQAAFTKWERRPDSSPTKKVSAASLRRFGPGERREKFRSSALDNLQQIRERDLFRLKDSAWVMSFPTRPTRPIMGLACKACTPGSKDFSLDYASKHLEVRNILKTETEESQSILKRIFCHIVHIWRFKKFKFPQVSDKVLSSSALAGALEDTTKELFENALKEDPSAKAKGEELFRKIYNSQEARARRILKDMRSTLSDFLLRITTWLLYKLFPRFLNSVCLHPAHLEMIQKAASTNLPLIFVPLHRSHLDYILITFILQNINVKSPLVAAGNNLKIPVFGSLLRGLGAFFIKRRIDPVAGRKDILYRAILHTYMIECLRAGHNIEFYIEGGRTRTGKPCMPKGGLLSVIVGAYMDGTVEDALLVPVSVNYDKLVDGNFISELLGEPKQMETFSTAISAIWTTLNSNYGSIRIDFNQPFSLRELVKSLQNKSCRLSQSDMSSNESESSAFSRKNGFQRERSFRSVPSTTSLYGTDVMDENHRALVDKIARHLIYDCSKACAIMSTNTLAFLLLNKYREGVSFVELVNSFDKLRQQLLSDNRDVGYTGESEDIIEHAIQLLGPSLVKREQIRDPDNAEETIDFITPVTVLPNVIGLSYYSNSLLAHFKIEGVVATSLCCSARSDSDSQLAAGFEDLMRNALELCDIFQFEFIFTKPCESIEHVICQVIDKFRFMEIISSQQQSAYLEYEGWSRKVAKTFDDSEEDEFYQHAPPPSYVINSTEEAEGKLELFHMMLRPYVDAYLATASCLHSLVNTRLSENEFVKEVLEEIKSQLLNGHYLYGESSSVELIKNALKLFKKWGVVDMHTEDSVRLLCLTDTYSGEEELQPIVGRISHFKFHHESDRE